MLILAGVSLNAIIGENGVITNAANAKLLSMYSTYKEETEIHLGEEINASGEKMKKYISSIKKEDMNNFVILNGKLYFIGTDEYEKNIAEEVGISTELGGKEALPEDVIQIIGEILPKKDGVKLPENDREEAPKELPGKRLYNKNTENDTKWDMVMDYNESSEETGRWGSGYYLLTKGEYEIDGKIIKLKKDYIIDYRNNELIGLSERYEDWNINSTLGTTKGLVLNLDPSNFEEYLDENGNLDNNKLSAKNIAKYGDVSYDSKNKQLLFNIDSNENDELGYIMLDGDDASFSKGFTFEFMGTFEKAVNPSVPNLVTRSGIFCRGPGLNGPVELYLKCVVAQGLVSGFDASLFCRAGSPNTPFQGEGMRTVYDYGFVVDSLEINDGFTGSITFAYYSSEDFDSLSDEDKVRVQKWSEDDDWCLCKFFLNGDLLGWSLDNLTGFKNGLESYDGEKGDFYIGVSPTWQKNCLCFFDGSMQSIRVYTRGISDTEVSENYSKFNKYLDSFIK